MYKGLTRFMNERYYELVVEGTYEKPVSTHYLWYLPVF